MCWFVLFLLLSFLFWVTLAIDCVPVMTIDKHEPDEIPDNDKDNAPNGKEITEKVIITYIIILHIPCTHIHVYCTPNEPKSVKLNFIFIIFYLMWETLYMIPTVELYQITRDVYKCLLITLQFTRFSWFYFLIQFISCEYIFYLQQCV